MWRRLLFVVVLLGACAGNADTTTVTSSTQPESSSKPLIGFSLSPRDYGEEGFVEFFETAASASSLIAWVGPWDEMDAGATVVHALAEDYGYTPMVVTGLRTGPDGRRVLPTDHAIVASTIATWTAEHPVDFLGFGVELDILWEDSPEDFDTFVDIFSAVSAAVGEVSPETVVFPGFQLERISGRRDGLYGGEAGDPAWHLLDRFLDAAAIGFTTYPGLIHASPEDLSSDYYVEARRRAGRPVLFTEVGWQAGGDLGRWSGSPGKQAAFVGAHLEQMAEIAEAVVWSFLWDPESAAEPFRTMGLLAESGERPAWAAWGAIVERILP